MRLVIAPIFFVSFRVFYSLTYCWYENDYCQKSLLWFLSSLFIVVAVDVNQLTLTMYFGILRHRMKLLRQRLETKLTNVAFTLTNTKVKIMKHTNIIDYLQIYRELLDAINSVQLLINISLCVRLACGVLGVLVWIYGVLKVIKANFRGVYPSNAPPTYPFPTLTLPLWDSNPLQPILVVDGPRITKLVLPVREECGRRRKNPLWAVHVPGHTEHGGGSPIRCDRPLHNVPDNDRPTGRTRAVSSSTKAALELKR
ncbi:hypothetical protein EVAR_101844_1 [Eumeta japonica]|uniref:Uncharacterized protein n=1 Tax=Eumeta variegata TaxID=151549 RepID=A0A4C1SQB7_EUMVA|nr:hypothetical protein EVAR_101844_1 [Eumeta japonica]